MGFFVYFFKNNVAETVLKIKTFDTKSFAFYLCLLGRGWAAIKGVCIQDSNWVHK